MKKIIALLSAIVLTVCVFAGCGENATPKAEEPKAESEYSVLTSDYVGEGEKSERSDYGDTIIIKDTDEEAREEAAPVEEAIEEVAPVEETAEESVVEEPAEKPAEPIETITKGYILTEIPEETKKIRGEGNYIVVEHEDSALKIAGKAEEEIAEEPKADTVYTVGEDSEGRKTIEGKPEETAEGEASERAEEIVTVLEDEAKAEPVAVREVVVDEASRKVIAERSSDTKKSNGYIITEEERATAPAKDRVVVEEAITPAPVPAAEPKEEVLHSGEEVVTVVDDEIVAEAPKKEGAYTITEEPDSAKRFEAKPKEEIAKGGYTLSVDPTQAKKIEGRPEIQYTVTSDENGKKVVTATPAEKTGAYEIKESEETKVIAKEHTEYEIEEISADTKVTAEQPDDHTGEVIVLDEDTNTVEASEETPEVVREVRTDSDATKIIDARVVEAPKAKGAYKISEERRDIQWKPMKGEPQDLLSEEKGVRTLLDAAKETGCRLVVLGTGPVEEELKDYAKNIPNVEFKGFQTGKPLEDFVKNSLCVVLPSEWYENGPYSAMEAMAAQTPTGNEQHFNHSKCTFPTVR